MVTRRFEKGIVAVVVVAALSAAAALAACSQTPTPVPVRTFERAGKMDVVCLRLFGDDGLAIDPEGRPQTDCTPVPTRVRGDDFQNQLFGLVTQTARGELAVVNLSGGFIEDSNRVAPGSNFLPVGAVPTDVAVTPDGRMAFVASAEPNKPAIYAIPTRRLLGDRGFKEDPQGVPTIASWPVCALPQSPGPITIVPRRGASAGDGGAGDAAPYEVVVVLPGDRRSSAKVVTLDPRPFLRGAGVTRILRDGVEEDLPLEGGAVVPPGSLVDCPATAVVELGGEEDIPGSVPASSSWSNGLPSTGGAPLDLTCATPASASCGLPACCGAPAGAPDAGPVNGTTPGVDCQPAASAADAGDEPISLAPVEPPRLVALARDDQTLYVADQGVPLIHVVDLSTPGLLTERAPLLATSERDPSRPVGVRALAVSPATRNFEKFLYAVDAREGSVMIFDVSDPASAVRTPLRRPNPELNPFQPPDRLALNAPVVAVTFARTDYPLTQQAGLPAPGGVAAAGLLCNPNPNAPIVPGPDGTVPDPGVFYRPNASDAPVALGPRRLRGVFALVTMSNGVVAVIDVDDWDAPCRRPALLNGEFAAGATPFSVLAVAQPPAPPGDLDPYHVPVAPQGATTNEVFFPVSAPHRLRSANLLVDAPTTGKRYPFVLGVPTVDRFSTPLPLPPASGSDLTPILTPTLEPGIDVVTLGGAASAVIDAGTADGGVAASGPRLVGPRISFESPDVHIDQDWTITYEGALPRLEDQVGTLTTTDGYRTITLDQPEGRFCAAGVEDAALGRDRAALFTSAVARDGRPTPPEPLESRVADYVQVTSELLSAEDPYWSLAEDVGTLDPASGESCFEGIPPGRQRYDACSRAFGSAVDENAARDFPILEAYDGKLVLGRFYTFPPSGAVTEPTRQVVYADPANASVLKQLRCCFHGQPRFRVRAASTWVTVGSQFGFLHKVQPGAGGRCVQSCDASLALRNARAFTVPPRPDDVTARVSRDSAAALRNPLFSFFMQGTSPERDTRWRFSTRGQFETLSIVLGGGQTTQVNPQSMRFVEPFNQVAVVDAASQGLVLIDLRSVVARASYF